MSQFLIKPARKEDCPIILDLICGLAKYEKLEDQCVATVELLEKSLFSEKPDCYSVIAWELDELGDEIPVGFALYFFNYSTFLSRRGLYLEDLFVVPQFRGKGYGKRIMQFLAKTAVEKGCGRFEWSVLDWNQPAINFYQKIGAVVMPDWRICRMTGESLKSFAK